MPVLTVYNQYQKNRYLHLYLIFVKETLPLLNAMLDPLERQLESASPNRCAGNIKRIWCPQQLHKMQSISFPHIYCQNVCVIENFSLWKLKGLGT